MKLYSPGDGWQTLTSATVAKGRTEGCRARSHAPRAAPVGRWSPMSLDSKGLALSVDHTPAPSLASLPSVSTSFTVLTRAPHYVMLRLVLLRCLHRIMTVKSFPALPIQQSKTVTISLSVGCGSAILSESSRLRLHPAHLPSLRTSDSPRIQRYRAV
jgi:hypothetical protein